MPGTSTTLTTSCDAKTYGWAILSSGPSRLAPA